MLFRTKKEGVMKMDQTSQIVAHNLQLMKTAMIDLLCMESVGGNAGRVEILGESYPCGAANMYADRASGKIVIFGNCQNIDESIKNSEAYADCGLHVACSFDPKHRDTFHRGFFKVLSVYEWHKGKLSAVALANLQKSIEQYNEEVEALA